MAQATAMMAIDKIKQAIPSKLTPNRCATNPQHHKDSTQLHEYSQHQGNAQKDPTQLHQSSLHQGNLQHHEDPTQLHESSQHQGNMQKDPTQFHKSSLHQGNPQHHEDPTQLHKSSQHQGNAQNNIEPAPPSQIWPNNLISILKKIMATPCQPPTKPIF